MHILCVPTCIGMKGTQHYSCVGGPCLHHRLAKEPGKSVWDHIRHVRWVVARYLDDGPNSCLAIDDNRVVFLMLTLKGDPVALSC